MLTIGPQTKAVDSAPLRGDPGGPGHFVTITAISTDVYISFDATAAAVSALTGTTTGTNQAATAMPVFSGTSRDFDLETADRFIGYVTTSGTGYIHIYISSNR